MNTITLISGFMILAGAGVMAVNIVKFRSIPRVLEQFSFKAHHNFWRFFRVHQLFMLFFFLGYVAVFVSLFQRIEFVGVFFVGVIFFFGALFVYLGILLQLKMLATIKAGYQEAVSIGSELDRERSNLLETNQKLTTEIHERQDVEYNLRESSEHLKATWDSISAGIIVIDEETHLIADANPSALSMIGASREKVLNNICHRFICPAELGSCPVTDKEEKIDKSERMLLTTTGEQVPILKTVTEINVKGRKHLLETFIDITQLKSTEKKLKEACALAESSNRAKSEFLANMSHELRTPLNHIIGFTEIIFDKKFGELTAEQEKYLQNVLTSGRHLLSLINDILDFSKSETGKLKMEPSKLFLIPYLNDCARMFRNEVIKKDIRLTTDFDKAPEVVNVDERRFKQIIYNLLSNAVKFTPQNGEIHLRARDIYCRTRPGLRRGDSATFQVVQQVDLSDDSASIGTQRCLEVVVKDTGIGLKPEHLQRAFNRFEQIDGSRSRSYSGTGLGLALTRTLVELHGGIIDVESEGEGKGCTFRFIIPIGNE